MEAHNEPLTCDFIYQELEDESIRDKLTKCFYKEYKAIKSIDCNQVLTGVRNRVPLTGWILSYPWKEYLKDDFFSGLTVGVMNIPQGLAYAMLAGVSSVHGLYVSFLTPMIYLLFGTSRHLSFGTFALLSLIISSVVESDDITSLTNSTHFDFGSTTDVAEKLKIVKISAVTTMAFMVGIIQFGLWVIKVGSLANFISPTVINAFSFGAMFHITTSQIKYFFGMKPAAYATRGYFSLFKTYFFYISNITTTNVASLVVGLVSIAFLMMLKLFEEYLQRYVKIPVPSELILIAIADGISYHFNFTGRFGVEVIGYIPGGLPSLTPPNFAIVPRLISSSVVLAIVSYSLNVSVAKDMASRFNNYEIDLNQEMFAYSMCNFLSSFFGCFVSGSSISRTTVQAQSGKTQISSIFSAIVIFAVILFLAFVFAPLPNVVLAAIIIVAFRKTFLRILTVPQIWKDSNKEGFVWIATVVLVICTNVQTGLLASVILNLVLILKDLYCAQVNFIKETDSPIKFVQNHKLHIMSIENKHICVFQWQGPIFYPSCSKLKSMIKSIFYYRTDKISPGSKFPDSASTSKYSFSGTDLINDTDHEQLKYTEVHLFYGIFDFSFVSQIDYPCIETIFKVRKELDKKQLLYFSGTSEYLYGVLSRYVNQKKIPDVLFFLTYKDAIRYCTKHIPTDEHFDSQTQSIVV